MDTHGVRDRQAGRLHRRVYNVMGPNHLWHIDTNHKLVRWQFIIVGGIDGFSRLVMFLKCTDNNTSETVLQCFLSGVEKYGIPNHKGKSFIISPSDSQIRVQLEQKSPKRFKDCTILNASQTRLPHQMGLEITIQRA